MSVTFFIFYLTILVLNFRWLMLMPICSEKYIQAPLCIIVSILWPLTLCGLIVYIFRELLQKVDSPKLSI